MLAYVIPTVTLESWSQVPEGPRDSELPRVTHAAPGTVWSLTTSSLMKVGEESHVLFLKEAAAPTQVLMVKASALIHSGKVSIG